MRRLRCRLVLPLWRPAGGLPGWSPNNLAILMPSGGLPPLSPVYPAFCLLSCPHPPTPFPGGEGGDFCYFIARGFAPCIPQGWWDAALVRRTLAAPGGKLTVFVACLPCLWFAFLPPSPYPPSPAGKGGSKIILCKGLRPLHPPGLAGRGTGSAGVGGARRGACRHCHLSTCRSGTRRGLARLVAG